jgi:hypothetical protein
VPSISIRASKVVCVAVFAALCLIGWVAEATLAQDPPTPSAPSPVPDAPPASDSVPQDPVSGDAAAPAGTAPAPPPLAELTPASPGFEPTAIRKSKEAVVAPAAASADGQLSVSDPDDPEKAAILFVETNRQLAESQLKNLKDEEAKLRTRLQKVEAGIKRWETLLGALKQSEGSGVAVFVPGNPAGWKQTVPIDRDEVPQNLSPAGPDPKLRPGKK